MGHLLGESKPRHVRACTHVLAHGRQCMHMLHPHAHIQEQLRSHAHMYAHVRTRGSPRIHKCCVQTLACVSTHAVCAHSRGEEDMVAEGFLPSVHSAIRHPITSLAGPRIREWAVHTPVQACVLGWAGCHSPGTIPTFFPALQSEAPGLQKREKPVISCVQPWSSSLPLFTSPPCLTPSCEFRLCRRKWNQKLTYCKGGDRS